MAIILNDEIISSSCSECGGNLIFANRNRELVCSECGLIIEEFPIWSSGHGINFDNFNMHFMPGAKYSRKDDLRFLKSNSAFLNTRAYQNPKLYRERRVFLILSNLKEQLIIQDWQKEQIYHRYLKISQKYVVINDVSLLSTLVFKMINEFSIPVSLRKIIKIFQDNGHRVNKRLMIRDTFKYDIQKCLFNKQSKIEKRLIYFNSFFHLLFESPEFLLRIKKNNIDLESLKTHSKNLGINLIKQVNCPLKNQNFAIASLYASVKTYEKIYEKKWLITREIVAHALNVPKQKFVASYLMYLKPILQSQSLILSQPGEFKHSPFFFKKRITVKGTE